MGWDVKATADSVAQAVPDTSDAIEAIVSSAAGSPLGADGVRGAWRSQRLSSVWSRASGRSSKRRLFSNWRLALLGQRGPAAVARRRLDDLGRHAQFHRRAVLSAMFTFGIHGVMLIVAWLIGESFATGMNQVRGPNGARVSPPIVALSVLGGGLVLAALVAYADHGSASRTISFSTVLGGGGAVVLATVLVLMFSKSDVVQPYAQGLRIVAKNVDAVGDVSRLHGNVACSSPSTAASTSFSPRTSASARPRSAPRTRSRASSPTSAKRSRRRRITEAEHLFQSDGWKAYDTQLAALSKASEGAEAEIEAHFTRQMEAHRRRSPSSRSASPRRRAARPASPARRRR